MRQRLTTTQLGYGGEHQALRAKWEPLVEAGQVWCHEVVCVMPTRWIRPGTPWHLAHTPDRQVRGPAHAKCNLSEVARRRAAIGQARRRSGAPRAFRRSQAW